MALRAGFGEFGFWLCLAAGAQTAEQERVL